MNFKGRFLILAVVLLLSGVAQAQTTFATVTGRVTDAAGAATPSTTVTIKNVETGIETTAETNSEGIFTISQLREGTYTLSARSSGFKEFVIRNIQLVARDLELGQRLRNDVSRGLNVDGNGGCDAHDDVPVGEHRFAGRSVRLPQRRRLFPGDARWPQPVLTLVVAEMRDDARP